MSSEKTAAATDVTKDVRFDPFAMLPFCGYHMGDYFGHWLSIGEKTDASKLPKLFWVNWFRKGADGKFLWPGYGENSRVLKWVVERVAGSGDAVDTAIGRVPTPEAIDTAGLDLSAGTLDELVSVDEQDWRDELPLIEGHYAVFGDRLPQALKDELANLEKRLAN
jgi:phosphoenolpyruvate carboxykinase (GTP)